MTQPHLLPLLHTSSSAVVQVNTQPRFPSPLPPPFAAATSSSVILLFVVPGKSFCLPWFLLTNPRGTRLFFAQPPKGWCTTTVASAAFVQLLLILLLLLYTPHRGRSSASHFRNNHTQCNSRCPPPANSLCFHSGCISLALYSYTSVYVDTRTLPQICSTFQIQTSSLYSKETINNKSIWNGT